MTKQTARLTRKIVTAFTIKPDLLVRLDVMAKGNRSAFICLQIERAWAEYEAR